MGFARFSFLWVAQPLSAMHQPTRCNSSIWKGDITIRLATKMRPAFEKDLSLAADVACMDTHTNAVTPDLEGYHQQVVVTVHAS